MSKYEKWIEYHLNKKARARTKNRGDAFKEFLAYKRGKRAEAEVEAPKPRSRKPKQSTKTNQPDDWSFLDD